MTSAQEHHGFARGRVNRQEAQLWAALGANAMLLETSTTQRAELLRERARLWDELAVISSPACGQAYRDAASQCRAESDRRVADLDNVVTQS